MSARGVGAFESRPRAPGRPRAGRAQCGVGGRSMAARGGGRGGRAARAGVGVQTQRARSARGRPRLRTRPRPRQGDESIGAHAPGGREGAGGGVARGRARGETARRRAAAPDAAIAPRRRCGRRFRGRCGAGRARWAAAASRTAARRPTTSSGASPGCPAPPGDAPADAESTAGLAGGAPRGRAGAGARGAGCGLRAQAASPARALGGAHNPRPGPRAGRRRPSPTPPVKRAAEMNYRFANLLGAPHRGGSVALDGDTLYSAAGNRVSAVRERGCGGEGEVVAGGARPRRRQAARRRGGAGRARRVGRPWWRWTRPERHRTTARLLARPSSAPTPRPPPACAPPTPSPPPPDRPCGLHVVHAAV